MYRLSYIQSALSTLIGWEPSINPANAIAPELTKSDTGLYYQHAHPLVTLDNIRAIIPDDFYLGYPLWDSQVKYHVGDIVRYNNDVWITKKDNNYVEPSEENSNFWTRYDCLSMFLKSLVNNGISQMIQTFLQIKGLNKETKNLLERRTLYDGAGRLQSTIVNRHKLVGFEITPIRAMGVTTKINRVGLQMTGATGVVRMYLFHSSQSQPINTFDLTFTKTDGGFEWFELQDCYLPYISDNNNSGGSWYLCYNQDELPSGMLAINTVRDWSKDPCSTCNGYGNTQLWRELTKYLQISPFAITPPETFAKYPEMWDIAYNGYTPTQSYGINCEISVGCDLTDFIVSQREIFATALQRQVAVIALRTLALNPNVRVNRNQVNVSRMDILYELDGNTQGRPRGLGYDLKKAYEALNLDTQGLDRVCLGCNNQGVRYSST